MTRRVRPAATVGDPTLLELDRRLAQHRARARRAWRKHAEAKELADPTAASTAHRAWSEAVDDALRTVEAISAEPVNDVQELLIKFDAVWWWLQGDDSVLDESTRRWLGRFRRSLRRLVREG